MASELERSMSYEPAFDRRDSRPSKNYGIHGLVMAWWLKGSEGALEFCVHTNWYLPKVRDQVAASYPLVEFVTHSRKPLYEDQTITSSECTLLGGECFSVASFFVAKPYFDALVSKGGDALWGMMESHYKEVFPDG